MSTRGMKRKSSVKSKLPSKVKKPDAVVADSDFVVEPRQKLSPGAVLIFGDGVAGQLGLGLDITEKARPAPVPDLTNIIEVAAGGMHTVCITSDHKVVTFGCNDEGALGRDTNVEGTEAVPGIVTLPGKVIQISAGDSHSSALLENGAVYVWGTFRDTHGSMGLFQYSEIEKKPVLLKSDVRFLRVASGSHHLVLLGENKHVYTCGCAEQGQLGRLSERASSRDNRQGIGRLLTPALVPFKYKSKFEIVDIWAGSYCTFAKDNSGIIYAFGLNNYKQLGVNREDSIIYHPTLAKTFSGRTWVKIFGGEHHTIALDDEGIVYTLGRKEYGRLGLGSDCPDAAKPTEVKIDDSTPCRDVTCGSFVSFAVTKQGKVYSWGMGSTQLGLGDEEDKFVPTLVTGKQLENRSVVQVASGGQHTVLLTTDHSSG